MPESVVASSAVARRPARPRRCTPRRPRRTRVERRGLLVVLAGVGDRGRAVGVLGALDELRLGLLEALGLAAAGLLDRAPGLVADARRPGVALDVVEARRRGSPPMWAASSAAASSCSRSNSMSPRLPARRLGQTPAHQRGEVGRRERVDGERPGVARRCQPALVAQHAERHAALGEGAQDPAVERALDQRQQLGVRARDGEDVGPRVVGGAQDDVAAGGEVVERGAAPGARRAPGRRARPAGPALRGRAARPRRRRASSPRRRGRARPPRPSAARARRARRAAPARRRRPAARRARDRPARRASRR